MPIDVQAPGSDGWWLARLDAKLRGRARRAELLASYLRGDPPLPEGAEHLRPAMRAFLRVSRTNWAELVSEACRERMQITGIRTSADSGETGDQAVWQMWRTAGMPVVTADVHETMLALANGYAITGWDDDTARPVVTAEDPRQVVTIHDPARQSVVRAAAKLFTDHDEGLDLAYLYRPGYVRVAVHPRTARARSAVRFDPRTWRWADEVGLDLGGDLPPALADVVPVVRFRNRRGVGEYESHLPLLDRINHMVLRRLVIAAYQAHRQRGLKADLPEFYPADHPRAGQRIDYDEMFSAEPGAFWMLPPDAQIWESGQVDLGPILNAVRDDVRDLAAVTRTPMHMLTPDAVTQSAEGAALAREGLVFRTEDRIVRATDGWRTVISHMLRFAGDTERADLDGIVPIWAPVERYSLAEKASAWSQTQDMPFGAKARHIWQADPDELARMESERGGDLLAAQVAAAAVARG